MDFPLTKFRGRLLFFNKKFLSPIFLSLFFLTTLSFFLSKEGRVFFGVVFSFQWLSNPPTRDEVPDDALFCNRESPRLIFGEGAILSSESLVSSAHGVREPDVLEIRLLRMLGVGAGSLLNSLRNLSARSTPRIPAEGCP